MNQGSVVITAGHAIYHSGVWHGGFKGEDSFYASHVAAGIRLMESGKYDYWIPSGAPTRPAFERETFGISEAEGMKNYAVEHRLCSAQDERILLETWARDSMENLFFGILAYRRKTGCWPSRVGVVSWNSKGLRYHLIASGMRLGGRIFFHGEGDYPTQTDLERACAAEVRFNSVIVDLNCRPPAYRLIDPLLRNVSEFGQKRWARMPRLFSPDAAGNKAYMEQVKAAYAATDDTIAALIDQIERLEPGDAWREVPGPGFRGISKSDEVNLKSEISKLQIGLRTSDVAAVYDRRLYGSSRGRYLSRGTIKPAVTDRRYMEPFVTGGSCEAWRLQSNLKF